MSGSKRARYTLEFEGCIVPLPVNSASTPNHAMQRTASQPLIADVDMAFVVNGGELALLTSR